MPSIVVEEIALSSYTLPQLEKMATEGSLFVDHLLTEAVVISDPENLLGRVRECYRPISHEAILNELRCCIRLLADSGDHYRQYPERYHRLIVNLARTYVYASAKRDGHRTFSMDALWNQYADLWGEPLPRGVHLNHSQYMRIRTWIEKQIGAIAVNPFGSVEALIVNAWGKSRLCVALGLRLLHNGDTLPPYEETDLWSDAWQ